MKKPQKNLDHGTSIAYTALEGNIFIAVDSQINHEGDNQPTVAQKLYRYNDVYWVKSGIYRFADYYDSDEIIKDCLTVPGTFAQKQLAIKNALAAALERSIPRFREHDLEEHLNPSIPLISTLLCAFENGELVFEQVNYSYENDGGTETIKVHKVADQSDIRTGGVYNNMMGSQGVAGEVLKRLTNIDENRHVTSEPRFEVNGDANFKLNSYQNNLYYLVYLETVNNPREVGRPILVVQITKDGAFQKYNN
jgi:hypothetical protein